MVKRVVLFRLFILIICIAFLLPGCTGNHQEDYGYRRFDEVITGLFDTVMVIIGYAESQEDFDRHVDIIYTELHHLHQLFDIFNEHPGINNIHTINTNAGIKPVEVDPIIIELLELSKWAHHYTSGIIDITMGPILNIWRESIEAQTIPPMENLIAAWDFVNINDVVINEEAKTVFLRRSGMSIDVGAIAKGFATEHVAQKAMQAGLYSFALSFGGNVRVAGAPRTEDENGNWRIGISDPDDPDTPRNVVALTHNSVVTSGDYFRFFEADGRRYHHIIDPRTLMPANYHRSVTVIHPDTAIADILSTAAFILEMDNSQALIEFFGVEAIWF